MYEVCLQVSKSRNIQYVFIMHICTKCVLDRKREREREREREKEREREREKVR